MEAKHKVGETYRSNEDPSLWVKIVLVTSIEIGYTTAPQAPTTMTWRSDFVKRFTKVD